MIDHDVPPAICFSTIQARSALPISSGESSWMKWLPGTVTSVTLGQLRQKSR
jgi:hypothetical protein